MENNAASNNKRVTVTFQPEPWLLDYLQSLENGLGKRLGYTGKSRTELIHEIMRDSFRADIEGIQADREDRQPFQCPHGETTIKTVGDCRMLCPKHATVNGIDRCPSRIWETRKRPEITLISALC